MADLSRPQLVALSVSGATLLAATFYGFYRNGRAAEADLVITGRPVGSAFASMKTEAPNGRELKPAGTAGLSSASATIMVHVAGAVKRPGVYRLAPNSRNVDALQAAGGPAADADIHAVNLAAPVDDGSQLRIPTRTETKNATAPFAGKPSSRSDSSAATAKLTKPGVEFINLNSASAEELERLPGVGPSTAARIIAFRKEIGRFTDTEQLMDVSGIGEKKFAQMRPFVRVR